MNKGNAVTVVIVVLSAIIPYLISQQDVAVPPLVKVLLTAANIGLAAYARLSTSTGDTPEAPLNVAVVPPPDATSGVH